MERVLELCAAGLEGADVRGRIVGLAGAYQFEAVAFGAESVQLVVEQLVLEGLLVDAAVEGELLRVADPQRRRERVERLGGRFGGVGLVVAFGLFDEVDAIVGPAA